MLTEIKHTAFVGKTLNSKEKSRMFFDLETTYTVCYISRLLGLSKRRALRYVDKNGMLTEKGIQTLHDLNEELKKLKWIT